MQICRQKAAMSSILCEETAQDADPVAPKYNRKKPQAKPLPNKLEFYLAREWPSGGISKMLPDKDVKLLGLFRRFIKHRNIRRFIKK